MSRYLNDEEYSAARQALVDAGYSESGADTELEKHQEKFRSTTDSLIKHFNESSAQRLALEGIGAALATYGAVEAGKGIYNRMFKKPETPTQFVEPSLDSGKPLANPVGSEPVLFEDGKFSIEKIPTAEQATEEQVKQGKIKTGKAGGSTSILDQKIINYQESSPIKEEVAKEVRKGIKPNFDKPLFEDRAAKKAIKDAVKGISGAEGSYLNMLGYDAKNPTSAKSIQALQAWEQTKLDAFNGIPPKSKPTGGNPTMHPEYQRFVQQNVTSFGPEVQSHLGKNYSSSAIREADKLIKEGVPLSKQSGIAPIEGMARSGLAALGILPVAQKIKEGDYKGALNEAIPAMAMIAPALSLAASPLYTSEEEMKILKNAEQKRKVGAGRGIAPPSDYMR